MRTVSEREHEITVCRIGIGRYSRFERKNRGSRTVFNSYRIPAFGRRTRITVPRKITAEFNGKSIGHLFALLLLGRTGNEVESVRVRDDREKDECQGDLYGL